MLPLDKWPREDVNAQVILAYTEFGEAFTKFGQDFPASKEHYDLARIFWELNGRLLSEGKIKTHPVALRKSGF